MEIPQTFKDHPYAWGFGGFLGLVLLFYWLFGSKSQPASNTSDYLGAYYSAQALAAQSGNQLSAQELAANAAVNTANIQAGVQTAGITAAQDIANKQTAAQATTAQDYINSLLSLGTYTQSTQANELAIAAGVATGNPIPIYNAQILQAIQNPSPTDLFNRLYSANFLQDQLGWNPSQFQYGPSGSGSLTPVPGAPPASSSIPFNYSGLPQQTGLPPGSNALVTDFPQTPPSNIPMLQPANTNAGTPVQGITTVGATGGLMAA